MVVLGSRFKDRVHHGREIWRQGLEEVAHSASPVRKQKQMNVLSSLPPSEGAGEFSAPSPEPHLPVNHHASCQIDNGLNL